MTYLLEFLSSTRNTILTRNPCVCITIAFICGIIGYSIYPPIMTKSTLIGILCLSALICICLSQIINSCRIPILFLWFAIAGFTTTGLRNLQYGAMPQGEVVYATITSSLEEKQKSYKATIQTIEDNPCKSIVYFRKDSLSKKLSCGDLVQIKAKFKTIENQENVTFDFKQFLNLQYIYSQAYISDWKKIGHESSLSSICISLRNKALQTLQELGLSDSNLQLIAALAFGDKSLLDDETKYNFSTAGAMHVLAVSGLHVGIINGILFFLFSFIRNKKLQWLKILLCISGIWAYACLTGMSPSVQRASIMCSMVSIALLLQRHTSTYNTLATAAFFSLLISPNDIFSVSFQLSYAAVISIVYFGQKVQHIFTPTTPIGSYLWGIIAVSIAVQIGTMPITLYYFGTIPTYSLVTNIIVIPLAFVLLICVVLSLATSWVPAIAKAIISVLNFTSDYMRDCMYDITTFPHASINMQITEQQVCYIYVFIALLVVVIEYNKRLQIQKDLLRL